MLGGGSSLLQAGACRPINFELAAPVRAANAFQHVINGRIADWFVCFNNASRGRVRLPTARRGTNTAVCPAAFKWSN